MWLKLVCKQIATFYKLSETGGDLAKVKDRSQSARVWSNTDKVTDPPRYAKNQKSHTLPRYTSTCCCLPSVCVSNITFFSILAAILYSWRLSECMRKSEYALALTKMIAGVQINQRKTLHLYLFIYLFGQWLLLKKCRSLWWRSHNRFEKINTKITDHEYQPSLTIVSEKCQSNCKFPHPPAHPPLATPPEYYCSIIFTALSFTTHSPYF